MPPTLGSFLAASLTLTTMSASYVSAEPAADSGPVVAVLECGFAVPLGYESEAGEPGELLFTRGPDRAIDRIVISRYDEGRWRTEGREIIEDRHVGHLRFIRLQDRVPARFVENLRNPRNPIVVLHTGRQQAILSGNATKRGGEIAEACADTFDQ